MTATHLSEVRILPEPLDVKLVVSTKKYRGNRMYTKLEENTWRTKYFPELQRYRFWYITSFENNSAWVLILDTVLGKSKIIYQWHKVDDVTQEIRKNELAAIVKSREIDEGSKHTLIGAIFRFNIKRLDDTVLRQ